MQGCNSGDNTKNIDVDIKDSYRDFESVIWTNTSTDSNLLPIPRPSGYIENYDSPTLGAKNTTLRYDSGTNTAINLPLSMVDSGGFLPSMAVDLPTNWTMETNHEEYNVEANYNKEIQKELKILETHDILSSDPVNIAEMGSDTLGGPIRKGVADLSLNKVHDSRLRQVTDARTATNSCLSSKQTAKPSRSGNSNKTRTLKSKSGINTATNLPSCMVDSGGFLPSMTVDLPPNWIMKTNQEEHNVEANYSKEFQKELKILETQDIFSSGSENITELGLDTFGGSTRKGVADPSPNEVPDSRLRQLIDARTAKNSCLPSKQTTKPSRSGNSNKTKTLKTKSGAIPNSPSTNKEVTNDDQRILLELEAKRLKSWERKVLQREKEIERKTAEFTDRSKQIAHIQSYVCQLEEKIKKAEENEHFYKMRLAARNGQESDQQNQLDKVQVPTPTSHVSHHSPAILAELSQRISKLELEMLQQRVLKLEKNNINYDTYHMCRDGTPRNTCMSNMTSQAYCRCKHPGNITIPTNEVYFSNKANSKEPSSKSLIQPHYQQEQQTQEKTSHPGFHDATHCSMKTSQQYGKSKSINQPTQEELSVLAQTLIDNCKTRINMHSNNYQGSNLQFSCELTAELELAAELEMHDDYNDNANSHMWTSRKEPLNGSQPANASHYSTLTTTSQKLGDSQHLQGLYGNEKRKLPNHNIYRHKRNSNSSEYTTQPSVYHNTTNNNKSTEGIPGNMNQNIKSGNRINTTDVPYSQQTVHELPKIYTDKGSDNGALRPEISNDYHPSRMNNTHHNQDDTCTYYGTKHVVEDSQRKRSARTSEDRNSNYHPSRSQTDTSRNSEDGRRKRDHFLYPVNKLTNLSPCGRSTGAIPKRHTTPKRRSIPKRRSHHQQGSRGMSNPKVVSPRRQPRNAEQDNQGRKILTKPDSNHPTVKTPFLGVGRASMGRPWRVHNNQ